MKRHEQALLYLRKAAEDEILVIEVETPLDRQTTRKMISDLRSWVEVKLEG